MIELKKFEDSLLNSQLNETGKPFNKCSFLVILFIILFRKKISKRFAVFSE